MSRDRGVHHPGVASVKGGGRKGMILMKKLVKMKHKTFILRENVKATER